MRTQVVLGDSMLALVALVVDPRVPWAWGNARTRLLRFEAITHNIKALGCGRVLQKFPDIRSLRR